MQTLIAVLKELQHFVLVEHLGLTKPPTVVEYLAAPAAVPARSTQTSKTAVAATPTPSAVDTPLQTHLQPHTIIYVALPESALQMYPTDMIDGVLYRLPYGAELQFIRQHGRWFEVLYKDMKGWVAGHCIATQSDEVVPQFGSQQSYLAEHPETIKLRTYIKDEFYTVSGDWPLQDIEYVYFKLLQAGCKIAWPAKRPRIAGSWQLLLRGQQGIHIGIQPKTGAVLERIFEDGTGQVGYVEAVHPDRSLELATVDPASNGVWRREKFTESVWREWRPVFIALT